MMLGLNVPSLWNRAITIRPVDAGPLIPSSGVSAPRITPAPPIIDIAAPYLPTFQPAAVPATGVAPAMASSSSSGDSCSSCSHATASAVAAPAPEQTTVPATSDAGVVTVTPNPLKIPLWFYVVVAIGILAVLFDGKGGRR